VRQDDNGNRFVMGEYPSRCEAPAALAAFESGHGHKQTYSVEEVLG
jgi:hypothetical protein